MRSSISRFSPCLMGLVLLAGCSASDDPAGPSSSDDAGTTDAALDATPDIQVDASPDVELDALSEAGNDAGTDAGTDATLDTVVEATGPSLIATIETSMGTIRVELNAEAAPITVENFQKYADAEFFDGLLFHRVIQGFMIQGGGLEPGLKERSDLYPPIVNEAATSGLSNLRGTIAMARTSAPDSATSQFFINSVDNLFLDAGGSSAAGYAVFGKVVDGMDVVDSIEAVPTHKVGFYDDVPVDDVIIDSIRVAEE